MSLHDYFAPNRFSRCKLNSRPCPRRAPKGGDVDLGKKLTHDSNDRPRRVVEGRIKTIAGIAFVTVLIVDLASQLLQCAAFSFRFENFLFQCGWARRFSTALFFTRSDLRTARCALSIFNRVEQAFPRQFPIHRLRPRILRGHADSARPMPQRHRGCDFVHVLTARSTGPRKRLFKIDLAQTEPRHSLRDRVSCHLLDEIDELLEESATAFIERLLAAALCRRRFAVAKASA
jgi:hypothetical protein